MQPFLLPLFPLRVVVFPRTPLPLHIFEERYKEMVGEAIRARTEFGVVLAKEDGIVNAGCTVVVDRAAGCFGVRRLGVRGVPMADSTYAGGGGGKECAARHERSNDWPQGGRRPP